MRHFSFSLIIAWLCLTGGCSSSLEVNSYPGVLQFALNQEITTTSDTVEIFVHHQDGDKEHREIPLEDELFIALTPDRPPVDLKVIFHRSGQPVWMGELQEVSPLRPGEVRQESLVVDPASTLVVDIPETLEFNASGEGDEPYEIIRIHAIAEAAPPGTPSSFDMVREGTEEGLAIAVVPTGLYRIDVSAIGGGDELSLISPEVNLLQGTTLTYTGVDLCHPLIPGLPCRHDNNATPTYESALSWTISGVYVARIGQTPDGEQALILNHHREDNRFRGEETLLAVGSEFHSLTMTTHQRDVYLGVTEENGALSLLHFHPEVGPTPILPDESVLAELDLPCRSFASPEHQFEISAAPNGKIALLWQSEPTILDWVPEPDKLGPLCLLMYHPETGEWTPSPVFTKRAMHPSLKFNGEEILASWETLEPNNPNAIRTIGVFNLREGNRPRVLTRIAKTCPSGADLPYALDLDHKAGIGLLTLACDEDSILSSVDLTYYSPQGRELISWTSPYPHPPVTTPPGEIDLRWTGSTFEGALVLLNDRGETEVRLVDLLDMDGSRNPQPGPTWTDVEDRNSLATVRRIPGMPKMRGLNYKKDPTSGPGEGLTGLSYVVIEEEGDLFGKGYLTFEADTP